MNGTNGENPFLKRKKDRFSQLAVILGRTESLTVDKAKALDELNFGVSAETAERDIQVLIALGAFERNGPALKPKNPFLSHTPSQEGGKKADDG